MAERERVGVERYVEREGDIKGGRQERGKKDEKRQYCVYQIKRISL